MKVKKIRVGPRFQASIPPLISKDDQCPPEEPSLLVWSPSLTSQLSPEFVDKYVKTYWDSFKYSEELSLGLIFYHGSNGHTSFTDLGTALPDPVPWTVKEITLFEAAFQYDGKDFERIHKLFPGRTMLEVIRYYYEWKTTNRTSTVYQKEKKVSQTNVDTQFGPLIVSKTYKKENSRRRKAKNSSRG